MRAGARGDPKSRTEAVRRTGPAVVALMCAVLLFLLTGCSSEIDEVAVPPQSSTEDTLPTSVALDLCAMAREAERRAAADLTALNREMDARTAAANQDSKAAAAEFSGSVAAAVTDARDRARAAADPIDPDGEYAAWIVERTLRVSPSVNSEVWSATEVAWERIDKEMEAERAIAGNTSFESSAALATASNFARDMLLLVAARTESELSQRIAEGRPATAADLADFAEASARDEWAVMRARSTTPEDYRDAAAAAIFDAARVVGRAVMDSPGPLAEIAAEHVQRIADIEASPLADEIGDASANSRAAQEHVVDACEL